MKTLKKAIGSNLLVKILKTNRQGRIVAPDLSYQKNIVGVVLSVGKDVPEKSLRPGSVILIEGGEDVRTFGVKFETHTEAHAIVDWKKALMIRVGQILMPLGKTVLIERINNEIMYKNTIVIPEKCTCAAQSLFGVATMLGFHNGQVIEGPGIIAGQIVHIQKWSPNIRELDIDNKYHVIVPTAEIDYTCDKDVLFENYVKDSRW